MPAFHCSLFPLACCFALQLGACAQSHFAAGDAGPPPVDSGPCSARTFVVGAARVETRAHVGLDLDGAGSEIGCGNDGPGGVDNALAGASFVQFANFQGIAFRMLDVLVTLDTCTRPDVAIVEVGARTIEAPIDSAGAFQVRVPDVVRISGNGWVVFPVENATLHGSIQDGALAAFHLSGWVTREASATSLVRFGDMTPDEVEELFDMELDPSAPGCDAISVQIRVNFREDSSPIE